MNNYIITLNTIDSKLIEYFVKVMILKTITIKKYVLDNIDKINTDQSRREIILDIITNKS